MEEKIGGSNLGQVKSDAVLLHRCDIIFFERGSVDGCNDERWTCNAYSLHASACAASIMKELILRNFVADLKQKDFHSCEVALTCEVALACEVALTMRFEGATRIGYV